MHVESFILSIVIYAGFSSPTPDQFGIPELCVAVCLCISVFHIKTVTTFLTPDLTSPLGFHRVFILWMMSVPLVIGVVNGHTPSDIIRDLIPIALLFLPIIAPAIQTRHLIAALSVAGGMMAARYLYFAMPNILQIGLTPAHDSLLYLANSPLIPFAAIMGFSFLFTPQRQMVTYRLLGFALFAICLLSMGLMVQRAPLALTIVACLGILAIRTTHTPLKTGIIATILFLCVIPFMGYAFQIYDGLIDKTLMVGANNRLDEMMAVISRSTLFGHGWGMEWQSPAVADYWVRYTHNMTTYYWLKAGVIGAGLSLIFIYMWMRAAITIARNNIAMGFAIIVPIIIHFFLYTGYKTFDISLLLVLIILCKRAPHPS